MIKNGMHWNAILMDPFQITRAAIKQILVSTIFTGGNLIEIDEVYKIPEMISKHQPQFIVMELYGHNESVLDTLRVITLCRTSWPYLPIIVCTAIENPRLLILLKNMGVRGICLKIDPIEEIINCITKTLSEYWYFSQRVKNIIEQLSIVCEPLTSKEIDVMEFIFSGKNVTMTSLMMQRDIRTVSTHKRNVMQKLGFKNDCDMFTHGDWMSKDMVFF